MQKVQQAVCFTGHRPERLGGYFPNPIQARVKDSLRKAVENAVQERIENFISGGALGVDQWAAEIILEMKGKGASVQLCIAKPFRGQEERWNTDTKKAYEKMLKISDQVIKVSEGGYAAWKMHKRNRWMVDQSRYVIAVWDHEKKGGTWSCLEYAAKKGKQIFVIDPFAKSEGRF